MAIIWLSSIVLDIIWRKFAFEKKRSNGSGHGRESDREKKVRNNTKDKR